MHARFYRSGHVRRSRDLAHVGAGSRGMRGAIYIDLSDELRSDATFDTELERVLVAEHVEFRLAT